MSITIQKRFEIAGVLTNATSVVLADPTNAYGVIRNDTLAVVVATGASMTNAGTGLYEYTFSPPEPGLAYTAFFRITYASQTYQQQDTIVDTVETRVDEQIPMPELTGDTLLDTLNSLEVERLRVARAGPKPDYELHGHAVKFTKYLEDLDNRILAIRVQLAQRPWELHSSAGGGEGWDGGW